MVMKYPFSTEKPFGNFLTNEKTHGTDNRIASLFVFVLQRDSPSVEIQFRNSKLVSDLPQLAGCENWAVSADAILSDDATSA
jgi:hypothetical protein